MSKLKLAIKTRNEKELIEKSILYHSKLVGWDQLVIWDHSSDCPETLKIYNRYIKRLKIVRVPRHSNPDTLHWPAKYPKIYSDLIHNTDWYMRLDSDEFLAYYDGDAICGIGIQEHLDQYEGLQTLPATMLSNYPIRGDAYSQILFTLNQIRHSVDRSKLILSGSADIPEHFCHCFQAPLVDHANDLVIMHLNKRYDDARIRGAIAFLEVSGLFDKNDNQDDRLKKCLATPEKYRSSHHRTLIKWYRDGKQMADSAQINIKNTLISNVIDSVINGSKLAYDFASDFSMHLPGVIDYGISKSTSSNFKFR